MFPTAAYDIRANRYAPHSDYIDVVGFDFTGATAKMEIRDTKNDGTLRATPTIDVTVTTTDSIPTSRITWTVPKATMITMPVDPANPDADVVLYHDMHITPSGEDEFVAWGGKFTIVAGVTE